jgi:hypothetical protein
MVMAFSLASLAGLNNLPPEISAALQPLLTEAEAQISGALQDTLAQVKAVIQGTQLTGTITFNIGGVAIPVVVDLKLGAEK